MFRITIREILLVTLCAAIGVAWWLEHRQASGLAEEHAAVQSRCADLDWKLTSLVQLIEEREGQVALGDDSVSLYIVAKPWTAGPGWTSKTLLRMQNRSCGR